jgi:hypothetical protein
VFDPGADGLGLEFLGGGDRLLDVPRLRHATGRQRPQHRVGATVGSTCG